MDIPIIFHFDERRAAQAAAWLLRRHGQPLEYIKLIALLYLADRRAMIETGCPITGDRFASLDHGPVLCQIYDSIKSGSRGAHSTWSEYVGPPSNYLVACAGKSDIGALSEYDTDLLDDVYAEFGVLPWTELCRRTRELPEWNDPAGGSEPIDPAIILRAEGLTEQHIEDIAIQAEAVRSFEAALAR